MVLTVLLPIDPSGFKNSCSAWAQLEKDSTNCFVFRLGRPIVDMIAERHLTIARWKKVLHTFRHLQDWNTSMCSHAVESLMRALILSD